MTLEEVVGSNKAKRAAGLSGSVTARIGDSVTARQWVSGVSWALTNGVLGAAAIRPLTPAC